MNELFKYFYYFFQYKPLPHHYYNRKLTKYGIDEMNPIINSCDDTD